MGDRAELICFIVSTFCITTVDFCIQLKGHGARITARITDIFRKNNKK